MTTKQSQIPIAGDKELIRLAASPAGELFRVLKRAPAMVPLVVVFAVIAPLYATANRTLDAAGTTWGFRSLAVLTAETAADALFPAVDGPAESLAFQPPLGPWVTAAVTRAAGNSRPHALTIGSWLSTAAAILMMWVLLRRSASSREAFWFVFLAAFHGPLLQIAQDPAPVGLSLALGLVCFWGFQTHLQTANRPWSLRLATGGVALGLCLLSGGPAGIFVVLVLSIALAATHYGGDALEDADAKPESSLIGPKRARPATSFLILCVIAAIVGGWWTAAMFWCDGAPFLWNWLVGVAASDVQSASDGPERGATAFPFHAIREFARLFGPLCGLAAFGFWRSRRTLDAEEESRRRTKLRITTTGASCALAAWLGVLLLNEIVYDALDPASFGFLKSLSEGALVLAGLVCAAHAMREIATRRVRVVGVVAIACGTFAFLATAAILKEPALYQRGDGTRVAAVLSLGFAALVGFGWLLRRHCRYHDGRQRMVIAVVVTVLVGANAFNGVRAIRLKTPDDRALERIRMQFARLGGVERITIVEDVAAPVEFRYTLQSLWPRARLVAVENWERAAAESLGGSKQLEDRSLILDWTERETRPAGLEFPGGRMREVSVPVIYHRRPVRAYLLRPVEDGS